MVTKEILTPVKKVEATLLNPVLLERSLLCFTYQNDKSQNLTLRNGRLSFQMRTIVAFRQGKWKGDIRVKTSYREMKRQA